MTGDADRRSGSTYLKLVAHGEFRAVLMAHLLSILGDFMAATAVTVLVFERTGSVSLSASAYSLVFLPFLAASLFIYPIMRWIEPRAILIGTNVLGATCMVVISWNATPLPLLFVAMFIAGVGAGVFSAARAAALPQVLTDADDLVLGRSVLRLAAQLMAILGSAAAGFLLIVVDPEVAILLNSCTFLASAAIYRMGTRRRPRLIVGLSRRDSRGGGEALFLHRAGRRLVLFSWLVPAVVIAPEAVAAPYAAANGSPESTGFLFAAMPLGVLLGETIVGRAVGPTGQLTVARYCGWIAVIGLVAFGVLTPSIPLAVVLLMLIGIGLTYGPGVDRLMMTELPDTIRTKAFAVAGVGLMAAQGLGVLVWGWAAAFVSISTIVLIAAFLTAALVLSLAPHRVTSDSVARETGS